MANYKIVKGDSLSLITWSHGRDPEDVIALFQSAKPVIGNDPHKISVGQVIALPLGWKWAPRRVGSKIPKVWIDRAVKALNDAGQTAMPGAPGPTVQPTASTPVQHPTAPPPAVIAPTVPSVTSAGGMSTRAKVGVGAVVVAAGGFIAWLISDSAKPARKQASASVGRLSSIWL